MEDIVTEEKRYQVNISLHQYKVHTIPEKDWFGKFYRVDIKFHDALGMFGPMKYDYFVYWSRESVDKYGASKPYILIATPKSLSGMREDKKDELYVILIEKHGVDIARAEANREVVVACDGQNFSAIGRDSFVLFFSKHKTERQPTQSTQED